MHFVLALHSHLPWVLNHGRWPHGTDWLCEAAVGTYLPLVDVLRSLAADATPAPVTLGITPVLANQLADPVFVAETESFLIQRIACCDEVPDSLQRAGAARLLPTVAWWKRRYQGTLRQLREMDGDILAAFRALEEDGRLETISSAATHGFLPLLGRDESIRLQLEVGRAEHRRLLAREPQGCWMPECAYRPGGTWNPIPGTSLARSRPGLETFLSDAGYRYFFLDAHMAGWGHSLDVFSHGGKGGLFEAGSGRIPHREDSSVRSGSSPLRAFRVRAGSNKAIAGMVREPRTSLKVWSRHHGYPGDADYLEFHKMFWPGGIRLWRVTDKAVDLDLKEPYDPRVALERAGDHAHDLSALLGRMGEEEPENVSRVVVAPFDAELFGHWWFEGADFLAQLFRSLRSEAGVVTVTASQHLDSFPPQQELAPRPGSWGANGDFSVWLNPRTEWTWERLWPLEEAFWNAAPKAFGLEGREIILAQAARELLLAQSSDWQFMISAEAVEDYARSRFERHCNGLNTLLSGLDPSAPPGRVAEARNQARVLADRDSLFPRILESLRKVVDSR